jgi:hypothetical protein
MELFNKEKLWAALLQSCIQMKHDATDIILRLSCKQGPTELINGAAAFFTI